MMITIRDSIDSIASYRHSCSFASDHTKSTASGGTAHSSISMSHHLPLVDGQKTDYWHSFIDVNSYHDVDLYYFVKEIWW